MATVHDYIEYLEKHASLAEAGSQQELDAAKDLAGIMQQHDLETSIEEFRFNKHIKLFEAVLYLLSTLAVCLSIFSGWTAFFALILVGLATAGYYAYVTDHAFIKKLPGSTQSQNVVGKHTGTGDQVVKGTRPIVIVAHYDTPHENLLFQLPFITKYVTLVKAHSFELFCALCITTFIQMLGFLPGGLRVIFWVIGFIIALAHLAWAVFLIMETRSELTFAANDNHSGLAALFSILNHVSPIAHDDVPHVEKRADDYRAAQAPVDAELSDEAEVEPLSAEAFASVAPTAAGAAAAVSAPAGDRVAAAEVATVEDVPADEPTFVESAEDASVVMPASASAEAAILPEPHYKTITEEVIGVRHGQETLQELGILPQDCVIEYVEPKVTTIEVPQTDVLTRDQRAVEDAYPINHTAVQAPLSVDPYAVDAQEAEETPQGFLPVLLSGLAQFANILKDIFSKIVAFISSHIPSQRGENPAEDVESPLYTEDAAEVSVDDSAESTAAHAAANAAGTVTDHAATSNEQDPDSTSTFAGALNRIKHSGLKFVDNLKHEGSVGPRDEAGLTNQASLEMANDLHATPAPKESTEPVQDPQWGTAEFTPHVEHPVQVASDVDLTPAVASADDEVQDTSTLPQTSNTAAAPAPQNASTAMRSADDTLSQAPVSTVARRATLFDLPDPKQTAQDPFGDPNATRVAPPSARARVNTSVAPTASALPDPLAQTDEAAKRRRTASAGLREALKKTQNVTKNNGGWFGAHDDSDSWKGGAAQRQDLRAANQDDQLSQEELINEVMEARPDGALIAHDIWFVATGASEAGHAGMKDFIKTHRRDLRGAFTINLYGIGAGQLSMLKREGVHLTRRVDRRIARLLRETSRDMHVDINLADFNWTETDATPAMRAHMRSITLSGIDEQGMVSGSHTSYDVMDELDEQQIETVVQLILEMIRRA